MTWILTGLLCIALVELVLRLPVVRVAMQAAQIGQRAGHVLRADGISDHWKEKVMMAYSGRLLGATGRLTLMLLLVAAVAAGLVMLFDMIVPGFADFITSWTGLLASLVLATLYVTVRQKIARRGGADTPGQGGYSAMDRMLHRLALGNAVVPEMVFDISQGMAKPDVAAVGQGRHVFVAGLARAGTTILMRRFHASGQFRSLTYRDMPFVLAPNLWAKLTGVSRRDIAAADRAHGDGLEVDADSPESLDEVFWRVFDGEAYIKPDQLVPHRPDPELAEKFRAYVGAILSTSDKDRYLSKNNNNLLRLGLLAESFPNALILVPFRDPAAHAGSLMSQHRNFGAEGGDDPFVAQYMGYLGHHEFGVDHRPFRLGGDPAAGTATPEDINYWLGLWIDVYGWLLDTAPASARFVCYERLCADPDVWAGLARAAELGPEAERGETFEVRPRPIPEGIDPALLVRARAIYDQLAARATT